MIGLSVSAFGIAWWLGLYVLARDPRKGVLRRAGLGLLAYAMALVVDQLGTSWLLNVGLVLTCLPALAWSGVFVLLGDETRGLDRWWRFGVVPLFTLTGQPVCCRWCPVGRLRCA
jgi:xanthine/uracil permease